MLLLGMKSDLRDHPHHLRVPETTEGTQRTTEIGYIVSEQRARRMAEALGVEGYFECSAKQDIDSVHKLFKVLAMTSFSYTGCTKSDQNHGPDYGQYGRNAFAWKKLFSMPFTHN